MRERRAWVYREAFPTRGDKAVRAQSIRGRMALNGLYLPAHAPWYPALRSELLSFPAGKYDDQVDALGLVGQFLDRMTVGQAADCREAEAPAAARLYSPAWPARTGARQQDQNLTEGECPLRPDSDQNFGRSAIVAMCHKQHAE